MIHTFETVIEQLSLAIKIMVKCSHAGPSNKSVNIFYCSRIGKWEHYSHTGIEYIKSVKHKTAHHKSKLTLRIYLLPILYDQAIRPRVDLFILLKPKTFFRGKMTFGRLA